MRRTLFLTVVPALLLSGCATLSEEECLNANWQTIGFEDGIQGYYTERVGQHREACAEYGVAPDMNAYLIGHAQGIERFCTHRKGLELGAKGASYNNVCPRELAEDFLSGYHEGRQIYNISQELKAASKDHQALAKEIDVLQTELAKKREMVIAQSTGEVLRRELLDQIEVLEETIAGKLVLLDELAAHRDQLQRNYQYGRQKAGLL
ncbi:MAG: DUF2799 domain-containing protein [Ketobacteraceae bacterium]|nr:DUF2799 domain-containing protein [Ketobacteraceae bacterium]